MINVQIIASQNVCEQLFLVFTSDQRSNQRAAREAGKRDVQAKMIGGRRACDVIAYSGTCWRR